MKRFEVVAGWLCPEQTIGTCDIVTARGKELISFSYDPAWLKQYPTGTKR